MSAPLSIYLHIPFCRRKCAYCDFASRGGQEARIPAYVQALTEELRAQARLYAEGRIVRTVFFGGGTPSLLAGAQMRALLKALRDCFDVDPDAEISMEANPGTVTEESLAAYRAAGVNRLSLGVQSFSDRLLASIGRIHTAREAERAVAMARGAGFDNLNLDLMYGLPGQSPADFAESVNAALSLSPEHLSLYSLIVEEDTPMHGRVARGEAVLPGEEDVLAMQHGAQAALKARGYERYEVSNYALPGRQCRHNLVYWRRGEYLGLGCAAHSLMEDVRFSNTEDLDAYLAGERTAERTPLTEEDAREETVMLGLRTREGIPRGALSGREAALARLTAAGLMEEAPPGRVRATDRGMDVLNALILELA